MFTYKYASLSEIDTIYDLYQRVIASTPVWGWDKDYPSKEMLIDDINSHSLVGYYDNDKIIAVSFIGKRSENDQVTCWKKDIKKPARWARICVDPTYQGKGIGYTFNKLIIEDLFNQGYDGIRIIVAQNNTSAIKMYNKFSFTNQGEYNFIDIDWYCYELSLEDYTTLLKVEKTIKDKLGKTAKVVKKINTSNNQVYIISYENKEFIFKIYHSKSWPEDGKIHYVNTLLNKLNIKHPKVIAYDRNTKEFKGGYLIEEFVDGVNPLEVFNDKQMRLTYKALAKYIKNIHTIKFSKYGYLNNGEPYYDKFSEYIEDVLADNLETLIKNDIIKIENIEHFIESYSSYFDCFDFPAVLCHGDLSIRNVLTTGNDLTLIDWDDAMAYPAFADIARMTFDMRYIHDKNSHLFTLSFLSDYLEENQINNYLRFESLYHIFVALDFLAHSIDKINKEEKYKKMMEYLEYLLKKL